MSLYSSIKSLLHSFSKGDVLVVLSAMLLVAALYIFLWGGGGLGQQAMISVNGKHWRQVDLYNPQIINVKGKLGSSVLQIEDGKIRFTASPCISKRCIHQGWMSQSGELLACLPNRVSIYIPGDDARFDTVNF